MILHDTDLKTCAKVMELPTNIYQIYWAVESGGGQSISRTVLPSSQIKQADWWLSVGLMRPIFDSFSFCSQMNTLKAGDFSSGFAQFPTSVTKILPPWSWSTKIHWGASLVAQWLRIRLPMQGTRVRALVREDPTCRWATKPVCHNYWASALEPVSHTEDPTQPKINK